MSAERPPSGFACNTVRVTVDGRRWLSGVYTDAGLQRLGAATVAQRVNEAIRNAQLAAAAAVEAEQDRFMQTLVGFADPLEQAMGPIKEKTKSAEAKSL